VSDQHGHVQENVKDRVRDLKKIYAMLNLPKLLPLKKRREIFDTYDCVFWCGDLNFRQQNFPTLNGFYKLIFRIFFHNVHASPKVNSGLMDLMGFN